MKADVRLVVEGSYDDALKEGQRFIPTGVTNARVKAKRIKDSNRWNVSIKYKNDKPNNPNLSVQDFISNFN